MDDKRVSAIKHIKLELGNLFDAKKRLKKRKMWIKEEIDKLPNTNTRKRDELEHEYIVIALLIQFNESKIEMLDTILSMLL